MNTQQSIINNNKFITKFMGLNYEHEMEFIWEDLYQQGHRNNDILDNPDRYKHYHNSWDELIPVVERIESLGYRVDLTSGYNRIVTEDHKERIHYTIIKQDESKIQSCYNTIVEFIKYYNQKD